MPSPSLWLREGPSLRMTSKTAYYRHTAVSSGTYYQCLFSKPTPAGFNPNDVPNAHIIDLPTPENQPYNAGIVPATCSSNGAREVFGHHKALRIDSKHNHFQLPYRGIWT